MMERRSFLRGMATLLAAPAIVRVSSLMPVNSFWKFQYEEMIALSPKSPLLATAPSGLLTPEIITKETLRLLQLNLFSAGKVDGLFKSSFPDIGRFS